MTPNFLYSITNERQIPIFELIASTEKILKSKQQQIENIKGTIVSKITNYTNKIKHNINIKLNHQERTFNKN